MTSPFLLIAALNTIAWSAVPPRADTPTGPDCRTFEPRPIGHDTAATPRVPQQGPAWTLPREFEHVLLIVLENQDCDVVMSHDYFRALARRGTLFPTSPACSTRRTRTISP